MSTPARWRIRWGTTIWYLVLTVTVSIGVNNSSTLKLWREQRAGVNEIDEMKQGPSKGTAE